MKRNGLIWMAALAVVLCLSSCLKDNGNVWNDEDAVTRSLEGITESSSMLDNRIFSLTYPKEWRCYKDDYGELTDLADIRLSGEGASVEIIVMPFKMLYEDKMKELIQEAISRGTNVVKSSITIDGIEGVVYTAEEKGKECVYWFRNGNMTVGIMLAISADCEADFNLEDCLHWKPGSNSKSDWTEEAVDFADTFTALVQKGRRDDGYMKVIPEESLVLIHHGRYEGVMSRERAKEQIVKFIGMFYAIHCCAEHNYTFRVEKVDDDGNTIYSHQFTTADYSELLD